MVGSSRRGAFCHPLSALRSRKAPSSVARLSRPRGQLPTSARWGKPVHDDLAPLNRNDRSGIAQVKLARPPRIAVDPGNGHSYPIDIDGFVSTVGNPDVARIGPSKLPLDSRRLRRRDMGGTKTRRITMNVIATSKPMVISWINRSSSSSAAGSGRISRRVTDSKQVRLKAGHSTWKTFDARASIRKYLHPSTNVEPVMGLLST
jgi:hypothetical protein